MNVEEIRKKFAVHELDDVKKIKLEVIRKKGLELACLINELCPDGKEKSIAMNGLDEVVMFANASVARND